MKTTNSYARIFFLLIAFAFVSSGIVNAQVGTPAPTGTLPLPCNCKGWSEEPVKIVSRIPKTTFVKCGGVIKLKKGSYALTSPTFFCVPSTCMPTYIWNITGPTSGTFTGRTYGITFGTVGTYNVTITPICGGHKCQPCNFKVVVI